MDTGRPTKTLADFMVSAINPVLIMVMVHSVCFFLVEVFYRGEAVGGVRWVLFWFVLAVVLITRIGIEQGDTSAAVYGLALASVTWFYLSFVLLNPVLAAVLLGIVWFIAHKITTNCTLIDEDADASGQGLLQSLRRIPALLKKGQDSEAKAVPPPPPLSSPPPLPKSVPKKKKRRSQTPGVSLIYFSIATIPIFGLGQTLLPANDLAARHQAFVYLFLYLAAALGLLITTSFLGLRRYLRQRYVTMPGNIALGWIQTGVIAVVIVLCLALLVPRPGARQVWVALHYHVDNQLRRASEFAARFNPHGTGPGRTGNQTSPNNQQENKSTEPGSASNPNPDNNASAKGQSDQQSGTGSQGKTGGGQSQGNGSGQAGSQGSQNDGQQNKPTQSTPPSQPNQDQNGPPANPSSDFSSPINSIYPWLKILFWIVVIIALAWLIYRYRVIILAVMKSIWAAIRNFIATLLGLFKSSPTAQPTAMKKSTVMPFKSFKNPFLTGGNQLWSPEKLITYSYDALQSWAIEKETDHGSPQTAREFCRQLSKEMPEAANALEHLAFLYGHVAYGASVPASYNPEHLRLIWDYMSGPRPKRPSVEASEREEAGKV